MDTVNTTMTIPTLQHEELAKAQQRINTLTDKMTTCRIGTQLYSSYNRKLKALRHQHYTIAWLYLTALAGYCKAKSIDLTIVSMAGAGIITSNDSVAIGLIVEHQELLSTIYRKLK